MLRIICKLIPRYKGEPIWKKWFWRNLYKKVRYGFDEGDLFSLDYCLTKFIYPRIRAFREDYEANPFNVPDEFLWNEQQKAVAKGAKWNKQWHRLDDKKLEDECWNKAVAKWTSILKQIEDGFADELLEENDWVAWNKKWQSDCDYINKKIEKATTLAKKEEIWNGIHTWRKYYTGCKADAGDMSYAMRRESKRLLFENYNKLWR